MEAGERVRGEDRRSGKGTRNCSRGNVADRRILHVYWGVCCKFTVNIIIIRTSCCLFVLYLVVHSSDTEKKIPAVILRILTSCVN